MGIQHIFTGTGVPTSTPAALGHSYFDTESGSHYVSLGTSSAADWRIQGNFRSKALNLSTEAVTVYHSFQMVKEQMQIVLFNSSNVMIEPSQYVVGGTATNYVTIALVTGTLSGAYLLIANYRPNVLEGDLDPSLADTLARLADAQTLENKTMSGMTLLEEASPATPDAGLLAVFAKADRRLYVKDSEGAEMKVGAGGGSKNWVKNPDAESSPTADVTFGAGVVAPTLAPSPLVGTKSFRVTGVATAGATTWWQWAVEAIDAFFIGKPMYFSVKTSASVASAFKVAVYNVTDSAEVTSTAVTIPGGMFEAKGFFIPVSGKSYAIRVTQLTNGTATCDMDDVYVGELPVRYGAGVMRNKSAVFSAASQQTANTNAINLEAFSVSVFSDSSNIVRTSATQVTLKAGIKYKITCNCNAENFSDTAIGFSQFSLVIDGVSKTLYQASSLMVTNNTINFQRSGPLHYIYYAAADSVLTILGQSLNATALLNSGSPICLIEEMEGTPTNTQIADRALEEFASNSNSTNTASDTTSFAYGMEGSLLPNGAVGTAYTRRVQFQNAIQASDNIIFEIYENGNWINAAFRLGTYSNQNGTIFGVIVTYNSPKNLTVQFGEGGVFSGATYGANGLAWSSLYALNWRWRVRKVSGGAQVGFPISSANILGRTDGLAPAAGVIGETFKQINTTAINITSGADTIVFTQVLTPGKWLITGHAIGGCNGNNSLSSVWNYLKINGSTVNTSGIDLPMLGTGLNPRMAPATLVWVNDSNSSVTVTLVVNVTSPGACYTASSLVCVRL